MDHLLGESPPPGTQPPSPAPSPTGEGRAGGLREGDYFGGWPEEDTAAGAAPRSRPGPRKKKRATEEGHRQEGEKDRSRQGRHGIDLSEFEGAD